MSSLLHAGPFSVRFANGELRDLRFGDREVLRRIYPVFQDLNWTNRGWRTLEESITQHDGAFEVRYRAVNVAAPFELNVTITGATDGRIEYHFDGVATDAFVRNRLGVCVLHPIAQTAGTPVTLKHPDGSVEHSAFPSAISPQQPFMNLAAITHEVTPTLHATVSFEGEVFETEDHRNWSDASFKTYCTPIALPFPVELASGTTVSQRVTVSFTGDTPDPIEPRTTPEIDIGDAVLELPVIGVGLPLPEDVAGPFPYFTEFNRDRDAVRDHAVVAFGITPQVHFFDDESIVQNLVTQGTIAQNARALAGDRQVWVHPVTLKPLRNPNATGPEPDFTNVDPRQDTWLGEAWTAMSIKHLAQSGCVDAISYYDDARVAGTPSERVFAEVVAAKGLRSAHASHPELVDALVLEQPESVLFIVANFSDDEQSVIISGAHSETITLAPRCVTYLRRELT